jgi:hypothetical protein
VTGRNGTVVDNVVDGTTTIAGVTAHLEADLGNGDNVVNVDNVYLAGHLTLFAGTGNDRLILGASGVVSTRGFCALGGGNGNDVLRAEDYKVLIADRLSVSLGGGYDSASLVGASSLTSVQVEGGRAGASEVLLRGVTSAGDITVWGKAPVNNIAVLTSAASTSLLVFCENGQNSVYIDTCYSAALVQVYSFSHSVPMNPAPVPAPFNIDATVTIARCQTPKIIVRTGWAFRPAFLGGNDNVLVYGNNIVGPPAVGESPEHVLLVDTGDGIDAVAASYNIARGNFFAGLAQADDSLTLTGNSVSGFTSVDGGDGVNVLRLSGNQFAGFAANRFS